VTAVLLAGRYIANAVLCAVEINSLDYVSLYAFEKPISGQYQKNLCCDVILLVGCSVLWLFWLEHM
jgi:hypothetical protein